MNILYKVHFEWILVLVDFEGTYYEPRICGVYEGP